MLALKQLHIAVLTTGKSHEIRHMRILFDGLYLIAEIAPEPISLGALCIAHGVPPME